MKRKMLLINQDSYVWMEQSQTINDKHVHLIVMG